MIIGVLAVAFDHQVINIRHGGFDLHAIDVHCLELERAQRTLASCISTWSIFSAISLPGCKSPATSSALWWVARVAKRRTTP